ncbi:hypothetical protein TCAL_15655 [Tigriopus californicus]|uniref:Uncharacterized protein n=1 Tax=Tigriopus californicus TaxID=6832 RepID=A0A553P9X7_TIGCA|nr:hypothetical protein TCAL_15655 [Tigriopus californicus]
MSSSPKNASPITESGTRSTSLPPIAHNLNPKTILISQWEDSANAKGTNLRGYPHQKKYGLG